MRATWLALVVVAGCQPSVASGTYLCGDEELCPSGQACDGPTNTCVVASTAMPFTCMDMHEPDDTPQQAFALPTFGCTSALYSEDDCLAAGDAADWRSFAAPTGCTAVAAQIEITSPIAFEPLALQLWDLTANTMVATGGSCPPSETATGSDAACVTQTLVGGDSYGIAIQPAGGGDCGGKCNFNRYSLQVQTVTP
ncbi:MAG TPA: hypothetical protein VMJ10_01935 [Kofleriaceae bacterium]|nr:hypothetical protein [Kofleriaceae bacterium]